MSGGILVWGDLVRGDFGWGDFGWGDFVQGGFWLGGFCPGGFCPGGYCPGGFCPRTLHKNWRLVILRRIVVTQYRYTFETLNMYASRIVTHYLSFNHTCHLPMKPPGVQQVGR